MPFFSIIIPTFNRYTSVLKAIESVFSQTFKDYELIVVDDGSTDETSLLKEKNQKNNLTYIFQENKGVSSARNTGMRRANGRFIAFLDSDDIWLPEKLEEHYSYIQKNPDILIHQTDEIWIRNGKRVNPKKRHKKKGGDIFKDSLVLCLVSPSTVVLKKELFEKYGTFDENLPVCEDYDLWLRIACENPIGLIEKKLAIKYGGHESQLSRSYEIMDIYRIYAILKLISTKGNTLKQEYLDTAIETVNKKCKIITKGAIKRDKKGLLEKIKKIPTILDQKNYSSIDYESLLKGLESYKPKTQ